MCCLKQGGGALLAKLKVICYFVSTQLKASGCRVIAVREGGACAIDVDACSREHGIEGGHAPSRRSKMRLNPSTSGGAAESTSSMYACNPPEGPSMCQRSLQTACPCVVLHIIYPLSVTSFMGRSASFMNRVTSFMRRLPIRGGYVFDVGTFASSGAVSCQPGSPSRSS